MNLAVQRQEILDFYRKAEKTRGSGWHPADPGSEARERAGIPNLSEHIVVLQDDDTMYLLRDDIEAVEKGITSFLDRLEAMRQKAKENGWDEPDLTGYGLRYQNTAVRYCKQLLETCQKKPEQTSMPTTAWNAVHPILNSAGVYAISTVAKTQDYSDIH